eukprot:734297-Pleurochrysis_carterae.AAC.18
MARTGRRGVKQRAHVDRQELEENMQAKSTKAGIELQGELKAMVDEKRASCAARDAERARVAAFPLALCYSDLKLMGVGTWMREQLKKHNTLGKTGFMVSQPNGTAYILHLQTTLLEADKDENDLDNGDSGIDGRSARRRTTGSRKRRRGLIYCMGYE